MTTQKAVTTLAPAGLPVSMEDMTSDAGLGGKMGIRDIAIPFLYILQTNSPQCNPDNAKYIKGATAGMLYLTVVEKVFEGREVGVTIVPCYYSRALVEWKPREAGGGIVASYPPDDAILTKATRNERGIPVLPNGNILVESAYHYVLIKDGDTWHQAIMPLKSTALKTSRKLNSIISALTIPGTSKAAPRFLHTWKLRTVKEQKDTNVWSAPMLALDEVVTADAYHAARRFCTIAAAGILSTHESGVELPDRGEDGDKVSPSKSLDDKIPF